MPDGLLLFFQNCHRSWTGRTLFLAHFVASTGYVRFWWELISRHHLKYYPCRQFWIIFDLPLVILLNDLSKESGLYCLHHASQFSDTLVGLAISLPWLAYGCWIENAVKYIVRR